METTLDILFEALEFAYSEDRLSVQQFQEAADFLLTLKG